MSQSQRISAVIGDAVAVVVSYYLAINFRLGGNVINGLGLSRSFALFCLLAVICHLVLNHAWGTYRIIPRYVSLAESLRLLAATAIAAGILFVVAFILFLRQDVSPLFVPAGAITCFLIVAGWRFFERVANERRSQRQQSPAPKDKILLVGAGQGADMLVRELKRTRGVCVEVVGMVDDNSSLTGLSVQGVPIMGTSKDVPRLARDLGVTQIVIAIPSARAEQIAAIYNNCRDSGVPMKIVPSLTDLIGAPYSVTRFRDLEITDLLRRPPVEVDSASFAHCFAGRRILVTGAAGSIGSELVRQLSGHDPELIVLVDHDESALYELHEQLQTLEFGRYALFPANILEERKLETIFAKHRPEIVFHAAAYKHVPLMEIAPDEAVLNNIRGTQLVARTSARFGVRYFINISTDKAVEPICVMGATKRASELVLRSLSERQTSMRVASVRFGNVLGSQGSVIPIFQKQIENGGPVVVTHPAMTRYFMVIREAVELVLQSVVMMEESRGEPGDATNGDVHILEMGEPVAIVDLAKQMIDLLLPDPRTPIAIEFIGLRPGEKLTEQLMWPDEEWTSTSHPLIRRVRPKAGFAYGAGTTREQFETRLRRLMELASRRADKDAIIAGLRECVPGYGPPLHPPLHETPLHEIVEIISRDEDGFDDMLIEDPSAS